MQLQPVNQDPSESYFTGEVRIVAEMACAHEGDPCKAHDLIDIASGAGVNIVQLQLFSVRRLVSPYHPNYAGVSHLEIPMSEWPAIIKHAKERNLHVWANVFDEDVLAMAVKEDVDVLKLHSTDLSNPRMLDAASDSGKPLSLAVGGSTLDEISKAVWRLRERGTDDFLLMHGYQGYPTLLQDARLGFIQTLRYLFGCPVGYQDHTDGESELALVLPLLAIGMGACVLEKHYTDNRARKGTDYEAALDPGNLARFVRMVSDVSSAVGGSIAEPMTAAEMNYRSTMKKTIVAARLVEAGEVFTGDMLLFMRAGHGLSPTESQMVIGKRSRRRIPKYASIELGDLEPIKE